MHAPAVFEWTACSNPTRHKHAAHVMGATGNVADNDAGRVLSERIKHLMYALNIPDGLSALGYTQNDI